MTGQGSDRAVPRGDGTHHLSDPFHRSYLWSSLFIPACLVRSRLTHLCAVVRTRQTPQKLKCILFGTTRPAPRLEQHALAGATRRRGGDALRRKLIARQRGTSGLVLRLGGIRCHRRGWAPSSFACVVVRNASRASFHTYYFGIFSRGCLRITQLS